MKRFSVRFYTKGSVPFTGNTNSPSEVCNLVYEEAKRYGEIHELKITDNDTRQNYYMLQDFNEAMMPKSSDDISYDSLTLKGALSMIEDKKLADRIYNLFAYDTVEKEALQVELAREHAANLELQKKILELKNGGIK